MHCGPELTAVTGIRSIVGSVEALISRRRNPFSSTLALEAIRSMRVSLERTAAAPDDVDARERSLYAAVMGTIATANAGVTGAHAVGLIVGGLYGSPHGVPHAIVLPPIMRAFAPELAPHAKALAEAFAVRDGSAAEGFERLVRDAGMATRLRDIGIPRGGLAQVAAQTAALPMMQNAPRPVDAAEIHAWLEAVGKKREPTHGEVDVWQLPPRSSRSRSPALVPRRPTITFASRTRRPRRRSTPGSIWVSKKASSRSTISTSSRSTSSAPPNRKRR